MSSTTNRRTWRRRLVVVGLAAGGLLWAGQWDAMATSHETVLARDGAVVTVTAGSGVANRVTVAVDGDELVVTDAATDVVAGDGCTSDGPDRGRCSLSGVTEVRVSLGDENDVVAKPGMVPVPLAFEGGDGNDTFVSATVPDGPDRFAGGPGVDTVSYAQRTAGVAISIDDAADDGASGEGDDVRTDVEVLFGGSGDDVLIGSDGPNSLTGGAGDDTVEGRGGVDAIIDHAGDDSYDGGDGDDVFSTTAGSDGADDYSGGPGQDTMSYSTRSQAVTVTLDDVADDGFAGEGDNVRSDVENVTGSAAGDTLVGSDGPNRLVGGSGDDVLDDRGGNDREEGGDGDDLFDQGSSANGADVMAGGSGHDTVNYAARSNLVTADADDVADDGESGEGDNVLSDVEAIALPGGTSPAECPGYEGDPRNHIVGTDGDDVLGGTPGDDIICGLGGNDILIGLSVIDSDHGDDVLIGGDGDDNLHAGNGDNELYGGDGNDTLQGGEGDDTLRGGGGDDRLEGREGDDRMVADGEPDGADWFDGGSGFDEVSYHERAGGVRVTIGSPFNDDGAPGEGDTVLSSVESVVGSQGPDVLEVSGTAADSGVPRRLDGRSGDDVLVGGPADDVLLGWSGDDTLTGGGGDDQLFGLLGDDRFVADPEADGADWFDGGPGFDEVSYAARATGVVVRVESTGIGDDGAPGEGDNVLPGIESVVGSRGDDVLELPGLNVEPGQRGRLSGGPGDDRLVGGVLDDELFGGPGDDELVTGVASRGDHPDGVDRFSGGPGTDSLSYAARARPVRVSLDGVANDGENGGAEGDNVGTDVEHLIGTAGGDVLFGSNADNVLIGGAGDDVLVGGFGDDIVVGNDGNDRFDAGAGPDGADQYFGGAGTDTISYAARQGRVSVDLSSPGGDGAFAEDDNVFGDIEVVIGGDGPDLLVGGPGDDVLRGQGGDDILDGAGGGDVLSGGAGTDTVAYASHGGGVTVSIDDVADDGEPGEGDNVRTDVEHLRGSAFDDVLVGSAAANRLRGGLGDDDLRGGPGNDVFVMEAFADGDDRVAGGPGIDIADYSTRVDDLARYLGAQAGPRGDLDYLGPGDDVEGIIGGFGDDTLGDFRDGPDVVSGARLFGGPGRDVISGPDALSTGDRLEGGPGNDRIRGLAGPDTILGGPGSDRLYGDAGDDRIEGGSGNDQIFGDEGADTLLGDEGDDHIVGGSGDDTLLGGPGFDRLIGGDGFDRCNRDPDGGRLASCEADV